MLERMRNPKMDNFNQGGSHYSPSSFLSSVFMFVTPIIVWLRTISYQYRAWALSSVSIYVD